MKRYIFVLQQEGDSFDIDVPSLDGLLDEILIERLMINLVVIGWLYYMNQQIVGM